MNFIMPALVRSQNAHVGKCWEMLVFYWDFVSKKNAL
jgi:hypothetical protein